MKDLSLILMKLKNKRNCSKKLDNLIDQLVIKNYLNRAVHLVWLYNLVIQVLKNGTYMKNNDNSENTKSMKTKKIKFHKRNS